MLILILFLFGLILLALPLLHPLTTLLHRLLSCCFPAGIRTYSRYTLANNKIRILEIQKPLLFSYALILFIDSIAVTQTSLLQVNLKYYYGSSFSVYPSQTNLSSVSLWLDKLKHDPVTSSLQAGWISQPFLQSSTYPTLYSLGRVSSHSLRL